MEKYWKQINQIEGYENLEYITKCCNQIPNYHNLKNTISLNKTLGVIWKKTDKEYNDYETVIIIPLDFFLELLKHYHNK